MRKYKALLRNSKEKKLEKNLRNEKYYNLKNSILLFKIQYASNF